MTRKLFFLHLPVWIIAFLFAHILISDDINKIQWPTMKSTLFITSWFLASFYFFNLYLIPLYFKAGEFLFFAVYAMLFAMIVMPITFLY